MLTAPLSRRHAIAYLERTNMLKKTGSGRLKKLVTFAFASRRRKIATLTFLGLAGVGSLLGGDKPAEPPAHKYGGAIETPSPTTTRPGERARAVLVAPTREPAREYINCAAVRQAGKAPLYRGDPGFSARLDRDGDGIACAN